MCDTIVAVGSATKSGRTLFGKNSDREPDEAQNLLVIPRQSHSVNDEVKCTYISIPQKSETYRVLLSKPFWMFGAEMGANEFGVVIGNEALMTKVKPSETGLTGMDLLRLALERSRTAKEARDTIISLLEIYGQGGQCGYRHDLKYMNGFLIADKEQAFVLETVEKMWAWKEVEDVWSISNKISIENDYDACSDSLIEFAIKRRWCKSEDDFNFSKNFSDPIITWGAAGKKREQTNRMHLKSKIGNLEIQDFMDFLRFHSSDERWTPDKGLRMTICAHAANSLTKPSQSVNSLIAAIGDNDSLFLTTGASNPCISPYFPVFSSNADLPKGYYPGGAEYDDNSYWWNSEALNRFIVLHYKELAPALQDKIEGYELELLSNLRDFSDNLDSVNPQLLKQEKINYYFQKANDLKQLWLNLIRQEGPDRFKILGVKRSFHKYWQKYNELNKIPKNFPF